MATRNIVPRATNEGQIGKTGTQWNLMYANQYYSQNTSDRYAFRLETYSTTAGTAGEYMSLHSNSGTIGTLAATTDGFVLSVLSGFGVNTSSAIAKAGQVVISQDGTAGATYVPGKILFGTGTNAAAQSTKMTLDSSGNLGLGTATWGTNAVTSLGIAIGTEPSSSIAGQIEIYAKDSSDGATNATLAFRTEQGVEAIGTFTPSNKLKIWINGTEYWIQLDAV